MKTFKTKAGTILPLLDLRGKDYLQVAHRAVWFREEHPTWGIKTNVTYTDKFAVATAEVTDENGRLIQTGTKREDGAHFADYIEKAETGAVGRALALCGYGTQFAPEFDEGDRLADAPLPSVHKNDTNVSQNNTGVLASGWPDAVEVPFGRNKGKRVSDLSMQDINNDITYWRGKEIQDKKPLTGKLLNYIQAIEDVARQVKNEPNPFENDVP